MKTALRCFVDASHHPQTKISVPGFKVEGEVPVRYEINGDLSDCVEAEKRAIVMCIDHCKSRYPKRDLLIHVDHEGSFGMLVPSHVKLVKVEEQLPFAEVEKKVRTVLRKIVNETV